MLVGVDMTLIFICIVELVLISVEKKWYIWNVCVRAYARACNVLPVLHLLVCHFTAW